VRTWILPVLKGVAVILVVSLRSESMSASIPPVSEIWVNLGGTIVPAATTPSATLTVAARSTPASNETLPASGQLMLADPMEIDCLSLMGWNVFETLRW
jgi:hypothetical protein